MATAADSVVAGEPQLAHTFKGHPQPPPNERLQEAKNYLADEDVNRNLGFKGRLTQIEEYLKDLEDNKTPRDESLFRDVRTMATVQREWMDHYMDAPPCDKDPCKPAYKLHISHRLISKESGRKLREEKESMGLAKQMRGDHAPFSTQRNDHLNFLDKLKKDESKDPDTIDEETNLLWVENRAYNWALREPSLIPVWLHPRLGLPDRGIKATDEPPWYREEGVLPSKTIKNRPAPQKLPHYLQQTQDTINSLLKDFVEGLSTEADIACLGSLLSSFELASLQEMRGVEKNIIENHPELVDEKVKGPAREKLDEVRRDIEEAHKSWLSSFAKEGVQLMIGERPVTGILQPGVFYFPTGQPSKEDDDRLKRMEARANELLDRGLDFLDDNKKEKGHLLAYLAPAWPPEMKRLVDESIKLSTIDETSPQFAERFQKNATDFDGASDAFLESFVDSGICMRYQRPGEIINPTPGLVIVPWEPQQPFSIPQPDFTEHNEDLTILESKINKVLVGLEDFPDDLKHNKTARAELQHSLEKVMYPNLRRMRRAFLKLHADRSAASPEEYEDIKWEYKTTYITWVNSFLHAGVQIWEPNRFQLEESPGILYLRDHNAVPGDLEALDAIEGLAEKVNAELRKIRDLPDNPEDHALYNLLVNLQYPWLKKLDEKRRELTTRQNPTTDEIKEEQKLRKQWRKVYNSWVSSFQNNNVQVRYTDIDHIGDPSVVWYRGSIFEEDRFEEDPPLTRANIDHAMFLLNWYKDYADDKVGLAARFEKASCLPPSLSSMLKAYNEVQTLVDSPTGLSHGTPNKEKAISKKNNLISAFSTWERNVRILARPSPASVLTPPLPPYQQERENEINRLLENAQPTSLEDRNYLNWLIEPYWQPQLAKLQERRKKRLRDQGVSEDDINSTDMSISTFSVELEDFKTRCRVRGFNIREISDDVFVAQDPDPGNYVLDRLQLEDILNGLVLTTNYLDHVLPNMNTNELREYLFMVEQDINNLLDIHHRSSHESHGSESDTCRTRSKWEEQTLMNLLRGFFPPRLAIADRQLHALSLIHRYEAAKGKEHVEKLKADAIKAFLDIYEPWIRRLANTKVHLVLGSGGNVEDTDNGILYVDYYAPRSPDQASDAEDNTTQLLSPAFQSMQAEINHLLKSRSSRYLRLEEEKRLRCLLRTVMPKSLAKLDGELHALSQRARTAALIGQEAIDYITTSDQWRDEYYSWLDEFTKKGVRLKRRKPGDSPLPSTSNIMFLQVTSPSEIPDDSTKLSSLPVRVQLQQTLLNRYLSDDTSLTLSQRQQGWNLLHSFWKPTGDALCQEWLDRLYQEQNMTRPEAAAEESTIFRAVVEAQLRNSFTSFVGQIISTPQRLRLIFVEVQPEVFNIILSPLTSVNAIRDEKMLEDIIDSSTTLFNKDGKIPNPLKLALEEFFPLAQKVQDLQTMASAPPLTDSEQKKVEALLQPLSDASTLTMQDDMEALWHHLALHGRLSRVDEDRLRELSVKQLWMIWGSRNPNIRNSTLQSVDQLNRIGKLVNPKPGSTQTPSPTIDPPTEADMLNLEVTVNELIRKFQNDRGNMSDLEWWKLKWLLQPLTPPKLRAVDRKLQELRGKQYGLDTNERLKFDELGEQFNELFYEWMQQIDSFGKLLDSWWFNRAAMQQTFIHAKLWEQAEKADQDRKSEPHNPIEMPESKANETITAVEAIKDPALRAQQENVQLLRQFAESYEERYEDRLLLEHMPPHLRSLYDEIDSLRDRTHHTPVTLTESIRLRIVTMDFVRDHINWISGLTPEQIKTLRGMAVDFSAKAERRGVQRAAIELGLNLLATNQEQHRPHDRFRRVRLPPKHQALPEEVPLWKPLDLWKRPVELEPFYYTKLIRRFKRWKEDNYAKARDHIINEQPGQLQPPANHNGPFILQSLYNMQNTATKRQTQLAEINAQLLQTVKVAPRPILERICALIGEAVLLPSTENHPIKDDIPLKERDLDVLTELCGPSWNIDHVPYDDRLAGFPNHEPDLSLEKARLAEFERDVMKLIASDIDTIPLWTPLALPAGKSPDPNSDVFFTQRQYDKRITSQVGISTKKTDDQGLIKRINGQHDIRAGENYSPHFWATEHVQHYLQAMHDYGRIHFDAANERVSRIPLGGHPENKIVLSEADAKKTRYIKYNNDTGEYEVQYDSTGVIGPPVVQPNKYQHLQRIAFRLGRDIRLLSELIDICGDNATRHQKQMDALARTLQHMETLHPRHEAHPAGPRTGKELSLKTIARDLVKYAPELRLDIGMDPKRDIGTLTENEAAQLIQLQLIEESNNNWESRFPEHEHVWDWADDPLYSTEPADSQAVTPRSALMYPKQYFSMRKWPVDCQSTAVQNMIKLSGPTWTDHDTAQAQTTGQAPTLTAAQRRRVVVGPYPRERYTGRCGPPNFPFGETPYQQAYQSFIVERDLKDVEEFRKPLPPSGLINTLKRKLAAPDPQPIDRFALPDIPAEWKPTNISLAEKRHNIIDKAKTTPGFPNTNDAYYQPVEIVLQKRQRAINHPANERAEARRAIEKRTGLPYTKLTPVQIRRQQDALNIDPLTEQFRPKPMAASLVGAGNSALNLPQPTSGHKLGLGRGPRGGPQKAGQAPSPQPSSTRRQGGGRGASQVPTAQLSSEVEPMMSGGRGVGDPAASPPVPDGGDSTSTSPADVSSRTWSHSLRKRTDWPAGSVTAPPPKRPKRRRATVVEEAEDGGI